MPTLLLGRSKKPEKERRILIRKRKAGDELINFDNLSNVDPHLIGVGKNIYRDIKVPNPLTNLFEEIFGNEKIISIAIS